MGRPKRRRASALAKANSSRLCIRRLLLRVHALTHDVYHRGSIRRLRSGVPCGRCKEIRTEQPFAVITSAVIRIAASHSAVWPRARTYGQHSATAMVIASRSTDECTDRLITSSSFLTGLRPSKVARVLDVTLLPRSFTDWTIRRGAGRGKFAQT